MVASAQGNTINQKGNMRLRCLIIQPMLQLIVLHLRMLQDAKSCENSGAKRVSLVMLAA